MPRDLRASPASPYDSRDRESILRYGRRLSGHSAREVCAWLGIPDPSRGEPGWKPTKNYFGDLLERYFQLDPAKHSEAHPDFAEADIELKLLPLKRGRSQVRVKEPTSISMIDYMHLPQESWGTALVRPKLFHLLLVFQVMDRVDPMASSYRGVVLYDATELDRALFEVDWNGTRKKVVDGLAHELHEADARVLAARRKGRGGTAEKWREQPNKRLRLDAPSRAWALKSAFTRQILEQRVLSHPFEEVFPDLPKQLATEGLTPTEGRVLASLLEDDGRPLGELAERLDVPISRAKSLAAGIVKRRLRVQDLRAEVLEFEKLGIRVRVLHLNSASGWPFEAVSFPAVDLQDLVEQDFEGVEDEDGTVVKERSELIDQLQRILFVVTYSPRKNDPQQARRLGSAFFWSPTREQWATIRADWEGIRDAVGEGMAAYDGPRGERGRRNQLAKGEILHMRPHGRDSSDEVRDPKGNLLTKQAYWLNQEFVYRLVKEYHALPSGASPREHIARKTRRPNLSARRPGADARPREHLALNEREPSDKHGT
jgi:DNA mismatch repair protein MutH